jgi:copper(I)-binding protein
MLRLNRFAWACAIACALCDAAPASYGLFTVNQPWVKPGTRTSEAFMVLSSAEGATLVGVRSSVAARAGLRGTRGSLPVLALPAGQPVSLRPNAERITLDGLAHPLRLGQRVPLTLVVATSDGVSRQISVEAEVRNESPVEAELRAHRH